MATEVRNRAEIRNQAAAIAHETLAERATYVLARLEQIDGFSAILREQLEDAINYPDDSQAERVRKYLEASREMKRSMRELAKAL